MTPGADWPAGEVGEVTLDPRDPAPAGSTGTWTLTYTVGPYGIDDGGGLKFLWSFPSDHDVLQFHDPAGPSYVRLSSTGSVSLLACWASPLYVDNV